VNEWPPAEIVLARLCRELESEQTKARACLLSGRWPEYRVIAQAAAVTGDAVRFLRALEHKPFS